MKRFRIEYTFSGHGVAIIEAKDEEQAEEIFYNGDIKEEEETEETHMYEIEEIKETKHKKPSFNQ